MDPMVRELRQIKGKYDILAGSIVDLSKRMAMVEDMVNLMPAQTKQAKGLSKIAKDLLERLAELEDRVEKLGSPPRPKKAVAKVPVVKGK